MNPTTELEKELLAALGETVLKLRHAEQLIELKNETIASQALKICTLIDRLPSTDPMAVDVRSVV